MIKGTPTLKFKTVALHYYRNGMLLDIVGALPFNLFFGIAGSNHPIIVLLRVCRIASVW